MKVSALSRGKLAQQLGREGINLQIGRFVARLQSPLPSIATGIELLYGDYPLAPDPCFADFQVCLVQPRTLRRWFRPQVLCIVDDDVEFNPLPLAHAFAFLEWGLNWCVGQHMHQSLVLHAAVCEKHGRAVVVPGPPGSGKSTLCAALVMRGWRLLSDELALISTTDGKLTPMPRPISLKNESIGVIKEFAPEATIGPEFVDTRKGTVAHMKAPTGSVERAEEPAVPTWLINPRYERGVATRLDRQSKGHTFMNVLKNAFNYNLLGLTGFETAARLIDGSDPYDLVYGELNEAIAVLDELALPSNRVLTRARA